VITKLKTHFSKTASNPLAKDTATMSLGNFARLFLQAAYFVAIARTLGPQQYGEFVAISAMIGIVAPFAGVGASNILLKNVSRDRTLLPVYWGNGLFLILVSGSLFTCVLLAFGQLVISQASLLAILYLSISELLLGRIIDLSSFAAAALGNMRKAALLNVYMSLSRLICILLLPAMKSHPDVQAWCLCVLLGSVACCLYAWYSVAPRRGISLNFSRLKRELSEASSFAIGASATTVYNDIDKTMLARLSDFRATGIYGAAYRIIDVSMAPVRAMTASAYPEFFRRGLISPQASAAYAYRLIRKASLFGVAIFVGLMLTAPLLPIVLGRKFANSVEAVRWLSVIPLLRCSHLFLGDALSGAGLNAVRTCVQIAVALINVGLNVYFIRHWTWRGAAWTSIMCDGLLVVGFAASLALVRRYPHYFKISSAPSVEASQAA